MSTDSKHYGKAAGWIFAGPLLILMALISTVESLTTYYIQLAIFGFTALICMATGIGYIFGWPWVPLTAKYLAWALALIFIGIPVLVAMTIFFKSVLG